MKVQQNIYIIVSVFLVVALLLIVFLLYPTLNGIRNYSRDIFAIREEVGSLGTQSRQLDSFKEKYQNYEGQLKNIDAFFVNSADPIDFIKFLEATARESDVAIIITLINAKDAVKIQGMPVAVFQIQATGDFSDLVIFSEKLETGRHLIDIKSITMKKSEDNLADPKIISRNVDANFLIHVITR